MAIQILNIAGCVDDGYTLAQPTIQPLTVTFGDNYFIKIVVGDSDGYAVNLTSSALFLTVKASNNTLAANDNPALISREAIITDAVNGDGYFIINTGDTASFSPSSTYEYDIVLQDVSGNQAHVVPVSAWVVAKSDYVSGQQVTVPPAQDPLALGPQGPAGATGATGPAGPTGPTGPGILNWRGLFNIGTTYAVNDAVDWLGTSYICTAITNGNFPFDGSAFWNVLAAAGANGSAGAPGAPGPAGPTGPVGPHGAGVINWLGTWNSGPHYVINDAVDLNGSSYICILENTNFAPPNILYWNYLAQVGNQGLIWTGPYDNTHAYSSQDAVSYQGSSYIATQATVGNAPTNPTFWNLVALEGSVGPQGPQGNTGATGPQGPQGNTGATGPQGLTGATGPQGIQGNTGATGPTGATGSQGAPGMVWEAAYNSGTAYVPTDVVSFTVGGNTSSYICILATTGNPPTNATYWNLVSSGIQGPLGPTGPTGPTGVQGPPGVTPVIADQANLLLNTTTATQIVSYTPSSSPGNFTVFVNYRVVTATTNLTITLDWTDSTGVQTLSLLPSSLQAVGTSGIGPVYIESTATAITVTATAGTANQVYVGGSIMQMGGGNTFGYLTQAYTTILNAGVPLAQRFKLDILPRLLASDDSTDGYTTLDLAAFGTAQTIGDASHVAQVTTDGYGRATAAAVSIQIAESQVTGLITDLANKVPVSTAINTAARLTGGGALSGNLLLDLAARGSNIGTFGDASHVSQVTVDAYGITTAANSTSIQIAESQVTGLSADLAAKANDASVVHLAGTETITGVKTFSAKPLMTSHISIDGYTIDLSANAALNQVLQYNGTSFVAANAATGSVTAVATDSSLTGGTITTSGTLGINLSNANTWVGIQSFSAKPLFTSHISVDGYTIDLSANATTNQALVYNGTKFLASPVVNSLTGGGGVTVSASTGGITLGTSAIPNASLANSSISFTSGDNSITLDASSALGGTEHIALNLGHANTWSAKQTFTSHIAVDGYTIDLSANAISGQVLTYNGTSFIASTPNTSFVTSITASSPLTGGTITTSGAIGIPKATSSADGYLAQGDWTTFNNKLSAAVTSITAGTGLSGGTITSIGTVALANTAVSPGSYTLSSITVDAQGRITAASNGTSTASTLAATYNAGASASDQKMTISGGNSIIVEYDALTTTTGLGLIIQNTTASTSGAKTQNSPALQFKGSVWDTTASATNFMNWQMLLKPAENPNGSDPNDGYNMDMVFSTNDIPPRSGAPTQKELLRITRNHTTVASGAANVGVIICTPNDSQLGVGLMSSLVTSGSGVAAGNIAIHTPNNINGFPGNIAIEAGGGGANGLYGNSAVTIDCNPTSDSVHGVIKIGTLVAAADLYLGAGASKIGFYNQTPTGVYSTTGTTTGFTANAGTAMNSASTATGNTGSTAYTFGDIVRALKLIGLIGN